MNRRWKVVTLALITAAALTLSVAAQESNTHKATAGLFGNDVDDFMDVHAYSGLEFDNYFGFTGYSAPEENPPLLLNRGAVGIGYARKFGGIYVGAYYNGNIITSVQGRRAGTDITWQENNSPSETETIEAIYDPLTNRLDAKTTTTTPAGKGFYSSNDASVLLGIAGMGFKVGFKEELITGDSGSALLSPGSSSTTTERFSLQTKQYQNEVDTYSYIKGDLIPSLKWGMGLELGGLSIDPYVDVKVDFHRDNYSLITKNYTVNTQTNAIIGNLNYNGNGQSANYIQPDFTVGAGITFLKKDGLEAGAGIEYGINFALYSNDYDIFGRSGNVGGKVSWNNAGRYITNTENTRFETNHVRLTVEETFALNHRIEPSFTVTKEIDERLKLGFNTTIGIGIDTSSADSYTEYTEETLVTDKRDTYAKNLVERSTTISNQKKEETTVFTIDPEFAAGASFQVIPNRFTLNAGVGLGFNYSNKTVRTTPQGYDYTKEYTVDAYGTVTADNTISIDSTIQEDKLNVAQGWKGLSGTVGGGFTFFFSPTFTVDAAFSAAGVDFATDLANVNILFTLKK
jgi:hypothetical protein